MINKNAKWNTEINLECTCYNETNVVLENMNICRRLVTGSEGKEIIEEQNDNLDKYEEARIKIFIEISDFMIALFS